MLQFLRNEEGAAGVEYGILVAAVAAVIIVSTFTLGGYVAGAFDYVNGQLEENCGPSCSPPATPS